MDIFEACINGDVEFVKFYINSGNNIEAIDINNQTPLHLACYCRNIEIVKLLLSNGANIDAIDIDNQTPLQYLNNENKKIINHFINALKYLKGSK